MRVLLYSVIWLLTLLATLIIVSSAILFFNPSRIINSRSINFILEHSNVLESWSWDQFEFNQEWVKWNKRRVDLKITGFCFEYARKVSVDSCINKLHAKGQIKGSWKKGVTFEWVTPISIDSSFTNITLAQRQEEPDTDQTIRPVPDYLKYWNTLWKGYVPPLQVQMKNVRIRRDQEDFEFDLYLKKNKSSLQAKLFGLELQANPNYLQVQARDDYLLPIESEVVKDMYVQNFLLKLYINPSKIDVALNGSVGTLDLQASTHLPLPFSKYSSRVELLRQLALSFDAHIEVENIKKQLKRTIKGPYNQLPAPLNAMDGSVNLSLAMDPSPYRNIVYLKLLTGVKMDGGKQHMHVDTQTNIPINLETFEIGELFVEVEFERLFFMLPRLARNSRPPQMRPDSRIYRDRLDFKEALAQKQVEERELPLNLWLKSLEKNSFVLRSNLLAEDLRLNFDLKLINGSELEGYISALPLKTEVFKRKVNLQMLKIVFRPNQEPEIFATIEFTFPEYKILAEVEGPLSNPRYVLSSEPPLPQGDIYAVLFFGRPLMELDPDDQSAASRVNYILSQGFLSLAVFYLFSGTPIEAIGYNPESNEVSAQVGLGRRSSLRIGRGEGGSRSLGVRYSMGGGWYVDTTARERRGLNEPGNRDYGILIERIIAY